jgi:tetratricopeptide (TPR) repeat protein
MTERASGEEAMERNDAPGGPVAEGDGNTALVTEGVTDPHAEAAARAAQGDLAGAAALYGAAAGRNPEDVAALLGLGNAMLGLGQYENAEREIRRALRLAPERPEVHLQLGLACLKRGVYATAVVSLRRTVELEPRCAPAYVALGEALNQMNEPGAAIEALEQALRLEPSARAYYALGIAFDRQGEPERAGEMYRRSHEVTAR